MKSPRFNVKEETLPVLSAKDYADPDATDLRLFRCLLDYIGIIRGSA
jgi:hypothetical protein